MMDKNLPPNFTQHLAYSASAGSGKTFALSVRYIALLFMGESASCILAATFTNKAAAEMRHRVLDSLRHFGENEAFLDAVIDETGFDKETLFRKQPEVLGNFLSSSSHIVTLDSFFVSILRSASLELGIEPDFVTKEESPENLENHFLDEVKKEGLLSHLVSLTINIEDKRFSKIFDMMQNFYKVDALLPRSSPSLYSIKDIEEEIERLRASLESLVIASGASQTAINNFILRKVKDLFGRAIFAKDSLLEARNYKKYVEKNPQIDEVFLALKEKLSQWSKRREKIVLQSLFSVYDYYKNANIHSAKKSSVLTFDDLTYFTYRLLYESISKEFLYFKIDAKFQHILLDEFQDTSTLQFLLLSPLIDEILAGEGQNEFKSFFYVGDTKQSLYRFRGGVEELFDKVAQDYGIKIEQMDTNYRSAKHIVESVNTWFEPCMQGYVSQKSRANVEEGYVEVLESEGLIDEAVKQIKILLALNINVDNIAFLVSTNKDGQSLQERCQEEGIETLLKTSSSLKSMPKIASLVAMCAYLFGGTKIDAHAMLLRVGKHMNAMDTSWFSVFMSPVQVLDKLVKEFGYFDDDLNILKLLVFASSFSDIPSFIKEFESSRIPVASNSIHGAKIMTIHGSKGLEFDHVILLDKLTGQKADTSPLIYHYDKALNIENILYRTKGREAFDSDYAEVMEKRKLSQAKDRMNILYVALTRAVRGLIVIRKAKKSIFDTLAMKVMSLGDKTLIKEYSIPKKVAILGVNSLSHYGVQETSVEEEEDEKEYKALLFGSALHYTLEMLAGFDASSLALAMMSMKNKYGQELALGMRNEIEKRIVFLLKNQAFQALLIGAKVRKEQSLSYEGELKKIDMILSYEESNLIIEYKSSKKYMIKDQNQVRVYQKALTSITGKKTEVVIVYLLSEGIELLNLN